MLERGLSHCTAKDKIGIIICRPRDRLQNKRIRLQVRSQSSFKPVKSRRINHAFHHQSRAFCTKRYRRVINKAPDGLGGKPKQKQGLHCGFPFQSRALAMGQIKRFGRCHDTGFRVRMH